MILIMMLIQKHYILYTSFEDNNKLKQLGCRWCPEEKLWYCINSNLDEVKRNFNNIFSNNLFEKNNLQIEYINEIISKKWLNHKPILEKDVLKYMNFKKTAGVQAQKKAKASIDIKDKLAPLENFN